MGEASGSSAAAAPAADGFPPAQESRVKSFFKAAWDLILEHWFILGLGFAIGFAAAVPNFGSMNPDLVNGLVVAMTMPTTISTNVVFTKQSGGNEAAALVNAVIGNIIGIFVSPGWLYLYLGKSGQAPYANVIRQLAVTIIAPLIVGQVVQYVFPDHVKKAQEKINFGKVGNLMIILLVWNTFCDTFHRDISLDAKSWVPMLFLEIGLFLTFSAMCLALATFVPLKNIFRFDKSDAVAVVMCGSTKTLALGMPLITVLYGKHAHVGVISLPLIIYHASQCLIGSLYIKRLKQWVKGPSPGAWPASCWPNAGADAAAAAAGGAPGGGDAKAPLNGSDSNGSLISPGGAVSGSSSDPLALSSGGVSASRGERAAGCGGSGGGGGGPGERAPWPAPPGCDVERGEGMALVEGRDSSSRGVAAGAVPGSLQSR
ncbi:hypothetical protein PLESTF_000482200 [Pleodorina starrii]|nr:hypothetical protein PLESTF_000482200 [Pleodorina starrii]